MVGTKRSYYNFMGNNSDANIEVVAPLAAADPGELAAFSQAMGPALIAAQIPESLWERLYVKLATQIFDAGSCVQFRYDSVNGWSLVAASDVRANQDIFLVDHAITYPAASMHEVVAFVGRSGNEQVIERLGQIMGIDDGDEVESEDDDVVLEDSSSPGPSMDVGNPGFCRLYSKMDCPAFEDFESIQDIDLDDKGLTDEDLTSCELHVMFPSVTMLSLRNNQISNVDTVKRLVSSFPDLKGAWFNGNPVCECEGYKEVVRATCPESVEILDSEFLDSYQDWAVLFCTDGLEKLDSIRELNLSGRNISFLKYGLFAQMPYLETLHLNSNPLTLSQLQEASTSLQSLKHLHIDCDVAPNSEVVRLFPNLVTLNGQQRSTAVMDDENSGSVAHRVLNKLPKFVFSYTASVDGAVREIFYTMDEVGSRMNHSCNPSWRMNRSVTWPVKDCYAQSLITRDYAYLCNTPEERATLLRRYMPRCWCGEDSCILRQGH